ncbi:hypothetical protein B0H15DRAFT_818980 [Mycena belliarum]|uniref:Uncharacterized protein n=1 Tax=Mycena belliarum TaxID=1033014 RepID=A0AAD6Y027_9AGAR|nr:hypothetical protein B0H15DRAFT_818980 [Mycena belliae]
MPCWRRAWPFLRSASATTWGIGTRARRRRKRTRSRTADRGGIELRASESKCARSPFGCVLSDSVNSCHTHMFTNTGRKSCMNKLNLCFLCWWPL